MNRRQSIRLLALAAAGHAKAQSASTKTKDSALQVLSFNLRYPNWEDGSHHWSFRIQTVAGVINAQPYDVIGVQEALRSQLDDLAPHLKDYQEIGGGRDDGKTKGEYSALLLRKASIEVLENGTFWLSDTPETPGSMTWKNKCPRIVTWAKVRWKPTGRTLLLANTHWDNASDEARIKSAALMAQRLPKLAGKLPLILTGDFNCQANSPALSALIRDLKFSDTFATAHPKADPKTSGTMHWFKGNQDGPRIDYILATSHWKTGSAKILNTRTTKLWPSDHYPINWTGTLR